MVDFGFRGTQQIVHYAQHEFFRMHHGQHTSTRGRRIFLSRRS